LGKIAKGSIRVAFFFFCVTWHDSFLGQAVGRIPIRRQGAPVPGKGDPFHRSPYIIDERGGSW
jgi:hypothetical protein